MDILIQIFLGAVAVIIAAYILPGIEVKNFWNAILVALVLALLNAFVEPLMIVLTIPVTIVTMGLFLFVINAVIVMLAGSIVPGFKVKSFWWALIFSIILSIIAYFLESLTNRGTFGIT